MCNKENVVKDEPLRQLTSSEIREQKRREQRQRFAKLVRNWDGVNSKSSRGTDVLQLSVNLSPERQIGASTEGIISEQSAIVTSNAQAPKTLGCTRDQQLSRNDTNLNLNLNKWMSVNNLDKYSVHIRNFAADLIDLQEMDKEDVDDLIAESKMPKMAVKRLRRALALLQTDFRSLCIPNSSCIDDNVTASSLL
jgi:hypothetical protein